MELLYEMFNDRVKTFTFNFFALFYFHGILSDQNLLSCSTECVPGSFSELSAPHSHISCNVSAVLLSLFFHVTSRR